MTIIFDTNPYRRLTFGKPMELVRRDFAAITGVEERMGFQVFMAPIPWMELFVHLADKNDPAFQNCLGAVVGSFIHSRLDSRHQSYRLMHRSDMLRANTLFGFEDEREIEILRGLNEMAARFNDQPIVDTAELHYGYLKGISAFCENQEHEFADCFDTASSFYYNNRWDENPAKVLETEKFFKIWVRGILEQSAAFAKVEIETIDYATRQKLEEIIADYFPVPYYLAADIITKMVRHEDFNIHKSNRRNWVLDYQMLFYISRKNTFILVTDDGAMQEAAKKAGIKDRVMTLEEYINILGLNIQYR